MSWAWSIPGSIAAVGALAALVVAWRTAQEAAGLRRDLERLGRMQPALVDARDEMTSTAVAVRRMRGGR